jgi:hypothetical protein
MKKILFSLFLIVFLLQFLLPVVNAQVQNYVDFIVTPTTPKYGITNILVKKKCFESDCYDTVEVNDYGFILKPGEPLLPMKNVILAIPYNAEISSIKEISRKEEILTGTYDIQPCPPIDYLGSTRAQPKPQKNMTIYGKNEFYPSVNYEIQGPYFYRGQKIILIKFYPIQYNPVTKTLKKIKNIHVRIYYSEKGLRTNVKRKRDTLLENFIYNYNQALSNGWGKRKIEMTAPLRSPTFEEGTALPPGSSYDYVLITDDSLANAAQPLVNWRNQHGIAARLITTSYIYSHYGGSNNAERIRNFIIDAYNNWGIKYVVLGGDAEIIPAVNIWPPSVVNVLPPSAYTITYNTYSDYYYAGLDGNWDKNGNGVLGEIYVEFPFFPLPIPVIVDEADWFPEVYVGRLPVSNSDEMSTVVNKIINYEANFKKREDNMLMLAAKLNIIDDCADTKEFIIATAINSPRMPSRYSVTKLYERLGNLSIENTINELNKGYKFVNYADHGTETGLNLAIDTSHIQNLTNINNLPFFYAMACLSGCFLLDRVERTFISTEVHYDLNYDCLGERLITANNGGVVGYIGATVPVPYLSGNMHVLSNALDEEFWFEFFPGYFYDQFFNITIYGGGYFNPGDALYLAKVRYLQNSDISLQPNRLVLLAFNLLGDPVINVCFSGSSECYEKTPNIKWCDGDILKICDLNCQYSEVNCALVSGYTCRNNNVCSCIEDINGDLKVDIKDVSFVSKKFGCNCGMDCYDPLADLNKDCKIDIKDVARVSKAFGKSCTAFQPTAILFPSSAAFLASIAIKQISIPFFFFAFTFFLAWFFFLIYFKDPKKAFQKILTTKFLIIIILISLLAIGIYYYGTVAELILSSIPQSIKGF